jgi:nucleoside-diphosphate-sugar epimerase
MTDIADLPTSPTLAAASAPARALVTGGAGFIGSHLVRALLARGARVRVLDDLSTGSRANLDVAPALELVTADIRDLSACHEACRGVDVVFHLAALGSVPRSIERPADSIDVNVRGTANVFTAARDAGITRLVYASSSSVYGDSEATVKVEGQEGRALSPYAASKAMDETLAAVFARCYALEPVGLRFFNVYGPRQDPNGPYAAVVPRFFDALLAGRPATIYGDGEQSRDFTYVGDAVAALLAAAVAPPAACGRAYNVGAGNSTTVRELERQIRALVGGGPEPVFLPARLGDVRRSLASTEQAQQMLGFTPAITLSAGLEATLAHYRERAAQPAELAASSS